MKTKTMNLLLAAALCLMCCAACTDAADEIAADTAPTPVPFTFTAVPPAAMTDGDAAATTRAVPGRDAWKDDGTEKIRVTILHNDKYEEILSEGIYTTTSPEGDVEVLPGDQPAFWPDKQGKYIVAALYPAKDLYDMTDQSTPEKFREADMLGAGVFDVTPGSIPHMKFKHSMVKVRVELTGAAPSGTPLILTAGVYAPPAAGQWTDGDVVAVEVDGVVKRYLASSSAGSMATLRPADADNTHYWPGKTASVRAWYYGKIVGYSWQQVPDRWSVSATQSEMPGVESGYQRSDFLYAPVQTVAYDPQQGAASGLTFYHQTARVVVRIRKAGTVDDANKGNIYVNLGYAPGSSDDEMQLDATFSATAIDPASGQYSGLKADETGRPMYIAMKPVADAAIPDGYARCYEALVIPQDMSGKHFIHVYISQGNGIGNYYYIPAAGEAVLQGGYTYTYDITVSEHGSLHVTAVSPIAGWEDGGEGGSGTAYNEIIDLANPPTINDNGTYLLTGSANDMTLNITGGSPTVIVRDLVLDDGGCIHITGGTPVIRVEGTGNSILCYDRPPIWLDGEDANVHVTGTGVTESELKLVVGRDIANAAIGTKEVIYGSEDYRCGNITISNLTLFADAPAKDLNGWGGAAIGTSGGEGNHKCGDITITDAYVKAWPGKGAASIGFGCAESDTYMTGTTYEMGTITLRNSTIESHIVKGWNDIYPAHIGSGAVMAESYTVGRIYINTDKSGTEFFSTFTGGTKADDEVIVGFPDMKQEWLTQWRTFEQYTGITWHIVPSL